MYVSDPTQHQDGACTKFVHVPNWRICKYAAYVCEASVRIYF